MTPFLRFTLISHSERDVARILGMSRTHLRALKEGRVSPTMRTLERLAELQNLELSVSFESKKDIKPENSVVGASYEMIRNPFKTWKIHFMNFVDEFRRSKDLRLVSVPPNAQLDSRLRCLFAATVISLCRELSLPIPNWSFHIPTLEQPWFPSESEVLKPFALVEAPTPFRMKNIFVLGNFLSRV